MTLVVGVDSSTQSCKIVVKSLETGEIVREGRAAHPAGTEVHPDEWWNALLSAVESAGGLDDVDAISIAGQQHGMVVLDDRGQVIRPALLWNDTRSAAAAVDLIIEFGADRLAALTGSVPVASFTATKLRWLRDAEPANAARVAAVALPHDWLTWRLRGFGPDNPDLGQLTTDRSDASGTSYWNPSTGDYERSLVIAALGHDAVLPTVIAPEQSPGVTAAHAGIRAGIVVGVGAGDNAAAALGLGAQSGDAVLSIGTSGTIFAVTDAPTADASGTVAGFADATGRFLPLVATLNAARVIDSIAGLLGVDFEQLGELALAAAPGSAGVVLTPYFEGERTPNLPDATATFSGLTLASTTRENIARAAIEGMLCGLADGLDAISALGVESQRLLLIGGAAQNAAVSSIAAEVFDIPVSVPEPGEYVAAGAAVQAAWALTGARPTWTVAQMSTRAVAHAPIIREQYRATNAH